MSKIAIVTDSNSGITQEEGRRLGVSVIPMPFFINEKMYLEGITLSQDEFYQWLKSDASISTSQPSPGETMGLWDNLLKEYDERLYRSPCQVVSALPVLLQWDLPRSMRAECTW